MKTVAALLPVASVFVAGYLNAQGPSPAGQDGLVDHLTGTWKLTGAVMCPEAHHTVTAEWVLNHQGHY